MKIDLETALYDPARIFKKPDEVYASSHLTREQKIEILTRWEYDVREREVAAEENMLASVEVDILDEILTCLRKLNARADLEHVPPTKLGGCDTIHTDHTEK